MRELLRPIEGEPHPNADQAYVQGLTPLHFASSIGNLDLVALLISAGASPSRADDDGLSAARYAGANAAVLAQLHVDPATLAQVSSSAKSVSPLQPPPTAHLLRPLLRPPVDESDPMAGKTEKKPAPPPAPNPESMQLLEDLLVALDLSKYAARFRTEGIDVRYLLTRRGCGGNVRRMLEPDSLLIWFLLTPRTTSRHACSSLCDISSHSVIFAPSRRACS